MCASPEPSAIPPSARRFTRDAARAVDREAMDSWGIPGPVLMENAARAVADVVVAELAAARAGARGAGGPAAAPDVADEVLLVCGPGNNGGDGWTAARHLANRRADGEAIAPVRVVAVGAPRAGSDAALNAAVTRRMGVPVIELDAAAGEDGRPRRPAPAVVVDAVLGTGVDRPAAGAAARAIAAVDAWRGAGARVVAVDVPSGLDADTGAPAGGGSAVRADVTVSFLGPKAGFDAPSAADHLGRVVVGDIGVPRALLDRHATLRGGSA